MVCVYCHGDTKVVNSRVFKGGTEVWRRRKCLTCGAMFTSRESADLSNALRVRLNSGELEPFLRERLLVSIIKGFVKEDNKSIEAAHHLTETVIERIMSQRKALIAIAELTRICALVLKNYNKQVYLRYVANHEQLHDELLKGGSTSLRS